jgi:pectin methylesterase-like acyl-CoA thioesterase
MRALEITTTFGDGFCVGNHDHVRRRLLFDWAVIRRVLAEAVVNTVFEGVSANSAAHQERCNRVLRGLVREAESPAGALTTPS